jgi:hypothetical protein
MPSPRSTQRPGTRIVIRSALCRNPPGRNGANNLTRT